MPPRARKLIAELSIGQQGNGNSGEHPANGSPGGLKDKQDADRSHPDVGLGRTGGTVDEFVEVVERIERDHDRCARQDDIRNGQDGCRYRVWAMGQDRWNDHEHQWQPESEQCGEEDVVVGERIQHDGDRHDRQDDIGNDDRARPAPVGRIEEKRQHQRECQEARAIDLGRDRHLGGIQGIEREDDRDGTDDQHPHAGELPGGALRLVILEVDLLQLSGAVRLEPLIRLLVRIAVSPVVSLWCLVRHPTLAPESS